MLDHWKQAVLLQVLNINTLVLLDRPKAARELLFFFFFGNKCFRDLQADSQWMDASSSAENNLLLVNWTNVNTVAEYKAFLANVDLVPVIEMAVQQSRAELQPCRCAVSDRSPISANSSVESKQNSFLSLLQFVCWLIRLKGELSDSGTMWSCLTDCRQM